MVKFWYDSNANCGMCENIFDIIRMCDSQIRPGQGCFKSVDEFLDRSHQVHDDYLKGFFTEDSSKMMNFGTRREHKGEKTLRQLLIENDLLDEFLACQKNPKAYKLNYKLKKIKDDNKKQTI